MESLAHLSDQWPNIGVCKVSWALDRCCVTFSQVKWALSLSSVYIEDLNAQKVIFLKTGWAISQTRSFQLQIADSKAFSLHFLPALHHRCRHALKTCLCLVSNHFSHVPVSHFIYLVDYRYFKRPEVSKIH